MFRQRLAAKLENFVEGFEGFVRKICFGVDLDHIREKSGSNWVVLCFEEREDIIDKREVSGAAKFENENEIGRVRMTKAWLAEGIVEDFFGEERI